MVGSQVHQAGGTLQYGTTNPFTNTYIHQMAEPHSPPPGVQAVPGSILDKARFFSIVHLGRFAVRLSTSGAQVHQAGGTLQYGDH